MEVLINQGLMVKKTGTELVPLDVAAFWDHSFGNELSPEGIHLLGWSKVGLRIEFVENLKLFVFLKSEIGNIDIPVENIFPADHQVINECWFPIEPDDVTLIKDLFQIRNLKNGSMITSADFLSILKLRNSRNLSVEFDPEILEKLDNQELATHIPESLQLKPYPYQDLGIRWLCSMYDQGAGAMLCDEMGLGKTLQAIGLIAHAQENGAKNILLCTPGSLSINWQREIEKFCPSVNFYPYFGGDRHIHPNDFQNIGLVQTTYDTLIRDLVLVKNREWDLVICDEAQALKNPDSQRSRAIASLRAKSKVLLTGTPVENSLRDLWALVNIVYPGLLGTKNYFMSNIDDNPNDALQVGRAAAPLVKRRLVKDVLVDLPPMVEIDQPIIPGKEFSAFYEELRNGSHVATAGSIQLARITALRQFCCYPNLVATDYPRVRDAKFDRLIELIEEIQISNQKVLIFATYTESLNLIKRIVDASFENSWCEIIDGRVNAASRQEIIDQFQQREGFAVLAINPEAGGAGLNITAANHVIHFNLPWNPAKEAQATARVYRPGQKADTVFVHRFYYINTIEAVINSRLAFKEELAGAAMEEPESQSNTEFVRSALAISPIDAR